jgi:hypothetical protein
MRPAVARCRPFWMMPSAAPATTGGESMRGR